MGTYRAGFYFEYWCLKNLLTGNVYENIFNVHLLHHPLLLEKGHLVYSVSEALNHLLPRLLLFHLSHGFIQSHSEHRQQRRT